MRSLPARAFRLAAALALSACVVAPASAEQALPSEHQVKAVFLLNFLKYVEWPPRALGTTNAPLEIVHIGEDRFGADLRGLVKSRKVDDRKVLLRFIDAEQDWKVGHVLFISDSEKRRVPEILAGLKGLPVLTVGESEGFLERGGMINFVVKDKMVRLEINLAAAEAAGLKLSSKLLAIADVVKRK